MRPKAPLEDQTILMKTSGGASGYAIGIGFNTANQLTGLVGDEGEPDEVTAPEKLDPNVWHHVAFTYDGAKMRLYTDGVLVATEAQSTGAGWGEGSLSIGCNPLYEPGYYEGLIDEVRIYNRALGAGEVAADMQIPVPPPIVTTEAAFAINANEAVIAGSVDPNGSDTSYRFEYGPTAAYGSTAPEMEEEVLVGTAKQDGEEAIAFLEPETTYHYRIAATSRAGTVVGDDETFTTAARVVSPKREKEERDEEESFTGLFSAVPADFVNLNANSPNEEQAARMNVLQNSGAAMIRVGVENLMTWEGNQSYWDTWFLNAAKRGMKIQFVTGSQKLPPKSKWANWKIAAESFVNRYGKEGALWGAHEMSDAFAPIIWEIWNEPNIEKNGPALTESEIIEEVKPVDPGFFGEFLSEASAAIKAAEPGAEVMVGGLLSVQNKPGEEVTVLPQRFLAQMGHESAYDAVALHPYVFKAPYSGKTAQGLPRQGPPQGPNQVKKVAIRMRNKIVKVRRVLENPTKVAEGKDKELWINEIGWPVVNPRADTDPVHPPVSPKVQGELVKATFNMLKAKAQAWNLRSVFYYNSKDAPGVRGDAMDWDLFTGLQSATNQFRPAWFEFQDQAGL